jgi:putative ABC transport system permease protein
MVRWAWRLFRREWRQQLLVLALITVAVAATIVGAGIGTNTPPPADAGFGSANHLVSITGSDGRLAADIAAIRAHFGAADVIENQSLSTGLVQGAQLRAQDPSGSYEAPMLALISGRYPAAGEVAMTNRLASTLGLRVGDLWRVGGRTRRVVGVVENPQNLLENFAVVAPGQLDGPVTATVLFDAKASSLASFNFPQGATPQTPQHSSGISPAVIVLVLAIFGLIFIGLVAVAGFTVLAQRRLRALGVLFSLGATDGHVRLVMVANGAAVGVVGALIGAVVGFAAWIAYAPHLAASAHHRVVWTDVPWWLIVTAVVVAVLAATLAARRPARSVARIPVVAALSGRPASPSPVHRSAMPGVVVLVVGLLLLASSGGWGVNGGKDLLFLLAGVVAVAIGLLLLVPLCVSLLAVVAGGAPIAVRIALRDLARYRARSGPALAATSLAVLMAVLISLIATGRYADAVDYFAPNLPSNQVVVYPAGGSPGSGGGPPSGVAAKVDHVSRSRLDADASVLAASLGSHNVLALEATGAALTQSTSRGARRGPGNLYVATPAVLRHYGINPAAIDPTTLLITSRRGLEGAAGLQLVYGDCAGPAPSGCNALAGPKTQTFDRLPTGTSDPNLLVTSYAVHELKLQVSPGAWLIETLRPLTAAQIDTASQAAAATGMTIETKNQAPSLAELRNYATAAGLLVALGVLAMTLGLIRSETAGDLRILSATGAGSTTRRSITSATAAAIGLLAGFLGTAVAYLATAAFFRSQLSERMSHPPVLDLLFILVGLPAVAAAGGGLCAGREPPAIARQPLG